MRRTFDLVATIKKEYKMKKTLLLAGVACLLSLQANAAELNPYVSGKLTYSDISFDGKDTWGGNNPGSSKDKLSDKVLGFSPAVGVSMPTIGGAVRAELEYNINEDAKENMSVGKNGPIGKMKLETQSIMVNAYYDFNTNTAFTPYVGAGIGYAKVKGSLSSSVLSMDTDDTNFAWQVGAGVAYALNDNVSLDLGYRYTDMGDISKQYSTTNDYKIDVDSHELLLGARYSF